MARAGWSTSNYLRTSSAPFTGRPWTVAGWITHDSTGSLRCLTGFSAGSYAGRNGLYLENSDKLQAYISSLGFTLSGIIATGSWQFVAWQEISPNSRAGWVGTTKTTNATNWALGQTFDSFSLGVTIGQGGVSKNDPATGVQLAEFGYWDRVLDDDEILQLAAGYTPDHIPRGQVGYWPLNDGTGNERDFVGGRTFTETGTVTKVDHPKMIQVDDDQLIIPASAAPPATIVGRNLIYGEKLNRLSLVG